MRCRRPLVDGADRGARGPRRFSGKTARKSASSSATCSSPFIAGAAGLDVGDVEQVRVGAAGKADRRAPRARASARRRSRRDRPPRSVSSAPSGRSGGRRTRPPRLLEVDELGLALDRRRPRRASRSISRRSCSSCGKISTYGNGLRPAPMSPNATRATLAAARPRGCAATNSTAARDDGVGEAELRGRTRACAPARPGRATSSPAPPPCR